MLASPVNFDPNQMSTKREISAAAINVSGRQRMLSQRMALLSLRLVCIHSQAERELLRQQLLKDIDLMQNSHNGLLNGDQKLKLSGHLSRQLKMMYFEPPLNLDGQIRNYIVQVQALAQAPICALTLDNPHLLAIQDASTQLLAALDAVVSQYQKESEAEQLALDINRAKLYYESCAATAAEEVHAEKLEQALQKLKQTQAQLIHTERISSLGQLVASLAHEINNPISFVHGNLSFATSYVQDLLDLVRIYQEQYPQLNAAIALDKMADIDFEFLSQDLPHVLSSMTVGIDRIREIVLSLRSFSRTDDTTMKPVDLHAGIDSTLLILQHRLTKRNPEIKLIKEYGNLPLVECYAGQINQVLANIISNGIDALEEVMSKSNDSIPEIRIRTLVEAESALILIADNGPGITEDVKLHLFDPFFTTKSVDKGTGLGLSICYQIVVEKHGGRVWCESSPGQGTQFWIKIPLRQEICSEEMLSAATVKRVF